MAFLTINQVAIPVAESNASQVFTDKGSISESTVGAFVDGRVGTRKKFDIITTPMTMIEARGMLAIIEGMGHTVSLSGSADAITGLSVSPGGYQTYFESPLIAPNSEVALVGIKEGLTSSGVPTTSRGMFSFDAQFEDNRWSVLWYEYESSWIGCARTSQGVGYIDGVRNDHAGTCGTSDPSPATVFSVSSSRGVFKFTAANNSLALGSSDAKISWIELIPEILSNQQLASMTTQVIAPISPSNVYLPFERPFVTVRGDILDVASLSSAANEMIACFGTVSRFEYTPCYIDGEYENNAVTISFSLVEFEEAYKNHIVPKVVPVFVDTPFEIGQWDNTPDPNISADFDSPSNLAEATFDNGWDGTPP